MKKVVLLLLLFYAKIVFAQPFSIGLTAGGLNYSFRQQPTFLNTSYYSLGLSAQYIYKSTGLWGIEANGYCYPSGENNNTGYWNPYKGYATAEYLFINALRKHKGIMLQFKAGWFYASYMPSSGLPQPDYGPAVGAFFGIFKLSKRSFLGLDVNYMCGLQSYLITGNGEPATIPPGNSDITNINFLLKYIHKL